MSESDLTALLPPETDLTSLLPPTFGDKAKGYGARFVQGIAEIPAGMADTQAALQEMSPIPTTLLELVSPGATRKIASGIRSAAGSLMPSNVTTEDQGFAGDLAAGLGSGVGFLVPGGALTKLGMKAGQAFGLLGVGVEAGSAYYEAKAHGATPEGQALAFLGGSLGGATEGLGGLSRVLGRIDKALGGKFLSALASTAIEEGTQEAFQGGLHDAFAKFLHDDPEAHEVFGPERLREAAVGGLVGLIFQTGASVLAGPRADDSGDVSQSLGNQLSASDRAQGFVQEGADAAPAGSLPDAPVGQPSQVSPPAAPSPSTERLVGVLRDKNRGAMSEPDLDLKVVEAEKPDEVWAKEAARAFGTELVLVDAGKPLDFPASQEGRTVILDRNIPSRDRIKRVLYHELVHVLQAADPALSAETFAKVEEQAPGRIEQAAGIYESLWNRLSGLDPKGVAETEAGTLADFATQTGEALTAEQRRAEGEAFFVENVANYLDEALTNPERLEALAKTPEGRNFLQKILDALRQMVARLTGRAMPSLQADLAALKDELARSPLEKALDPQVAARIALTLRAGFAGLERLPPIVAQPAASQAVSRKAGRAIPEGTVLYHGTRGSLVPGAERHLYLTENAQEAVAYAEGMIPGTGQGQKGKPEVYTLTVENGARVFDANARVEAAVMETSEETVDEAVAGALEDAKAGGFAFVGFQHPSAVGGDEINVYVAVDKRAGDRAKPKKADPRRPGGRVVQGPPVRPVEEAKPAPPSEPPAAVEAEPEAAPEARRSSPDIRFAVRPDPLGFFSRLEQTLDEKIQGKRATVAQVKALLRDVKAEEVQWSGIEDFLKGKQAVSKDELLAFVRENNVQVQEVTLGSERTPLEWKREGNLWSPTRQSNVRYIEELQNGRFRIVYDSGLVGMGQTLEEAQAAADAGDANFFRPSTKHASYQLPGGENYRELLLTLPGAERKPLEFLVEHRPDLSRPWVVRRMSETEHLQSFKTEQEARDFAALARTTAHPDATDFVAGQAFTGGHYGETPNVLAHVRFNERADASGERVLFIEEVQSDWHQEGRKKGYGAADRWVVYRSLSATQREFAGYSETEDGAKAMAADLAAVPQPSPYTRYEVVKESWRQGVPDAPFKTSWHELALKRMVRWAAEHGFDKVAWTTGAQQVERYETAYRQAVDAIRWEPDVMGKSHREVDVEKDGNSVAAFYIDERGVVTEGRGAAGNEAKGKPIEDVVGKEIARRILSEPSGKVEGEGLTIGGRGMEGFYDQMLPAAANKIGKRFGARVEPTTVETFVQGTKSYEANMLVAKPVQVHSLPITPDMRATVMEQGFPRFAVSTEQGPSWSVPDDRLRDRFARGLLSEFDRLKKDETEAGVGEEESAYRQLQLMRDAIGGQWLGQRHKAKKTLKPLIDAGGSVPTLDTYSLARHAPDRNRAIMDAFPDGGWGTEFKPGSGMTNSEAAKIVREVEAGKLGPLYKRTADAVDAMLKENRARMVEAGLITQDTADNWEERFGPHYRPLKTVGEPEAQAFPSVKKLTVKGPESKQARGRRSQATDLTVQALSQIEETITRAERTRFGQKFGEVAKAHPNPEVWEFYDDYAEIAKEDHGSVFTYKENGREQYVVVRDPLLNTALQRLNANGSEFLRVVSGAANFFKRLHTTWNVAFTLPNLARDLSLAGITLTAEESAGFAASALAPSRMTKNARAMWRVLRAFDAKGEREDMVRRYIESGGMTNWVPPQSFEQRAKEVANGLKDPKGILPALRGLVSLLEDSSGALENATRLSVFETALERGYSVEKAATMAKEVTVNFSRKGTWSSGIGALYLFFNAGMQGTARAGRLFANPQSRRVAAALTSGIFATGFMLSFLNRMMGGDDEDGFNLWDNVQDYQITRTLVLLIPGSDGKQLRIPLPWLFNIPFYAGQKAERIAFGRDDPVQAAGLIGAASLEAMAPIGGEANFTQNLSFWFTDPIVQLEQNQEWYGGPIMPSPSPFDPAPPPDSTRYWPNVNPALRSFTGWLNQATGGSQIEAGAVDVSPESVEHVLAFLTGGAGRTAGRGFDVAQKLLQGEPIDLNKLPILNRFVGEPDVRFLRVEMKEAEQRIAYEKKKQKERMPFDRRLLSLEGRLKLAEKRVKAAREAEDEDAEEAARRAFVKAYRSVKGET